MFRNWVYEIIIITTIIIIIIKTCVSPRLRIHWTIFDISTITYLTHQVEHSDTQYFILSKSIVNSESSVDYLLKDIKHLALKMSEE